jgi:hypothetical protein
MLFSSIIESDFSSDNSDKIDFLGELLMNFIESIYSISELSLLICFHYFILLLIPILLERICFYLL